MLIGAQLTHQINIGGTEATNDRQSLRISLQRRRTITSQIGSIYLILLIHAATLYVLLTRTTPGCIILAIALSLNIPTIRSWHRPLLLASASICLIWNPNRLDIFGYLILVTLLRIVPTTLPTIPLFWLTGPIRIVILFSRVSIVNFLAGLWSQQYIVLTAILLRIVSRLLGYNN